MTAKKSALLALIFIAGLVGGLVVSGRMSTTTPSLALPETTQSRSQAIAAGPLPDLSAVAERAIQASANISSTRVLRQRTDPFWQFFGLGEPYARHAQSLGSGVVVSSDGYILTNNHVIGRETDRVDIRVTLPGSREVPATVVGADPVTDLAVVKIQAQGLATLPWGDSDKLRVAEWVLAIGNPFAFNQTVTLGIVSATSRRDPQLGSYGSLIQTDAAINPGNSGGALINSRGELIGINQSIYSETGGYQGIGFAIPSNLAHRIMTELIKNREVRWGTIGTVDWQTIDPGTARRAGVPAGVLLYDLDPASSAFRAGLRPDDIIVSFNGQKVADESSLKRLIEDARIGTTARVEIWRNGRTTIANVPIESTTDQKRKR